jgi:hypothetical protein
MKIIAMNRFEAPRDFRMPICPRHLTDCMIKRAAQLKSLHSVDTGFTQL